MKIYLISPRYDVPAYFGSEVLRDLMLEPVNYIAELTLPTIASLIPSDIEVEICDENLTEVDFDIDAIIFITGKNDQIHRMKEISGEFRKRYKTVVMGGALATLNPHLLRDYCDVLVTGELESIVNDLINDLKGKVCRTEYRGRHCNFDEPVTPRWDLYPCDRALMGSVQTSRGCKYSCDFCQVAHYSGKPRCKRAKQVIEELEVLYKNGFRYVFISDDNFNTNRDHTMNLLKEIECWNVKEEPMFFLTQISIDTASDRELLKMCARAGIISVFVGIETNNEENLADIHKLHNIGLNIKEQVETFLEEGIVVMSGIMFGFDEDNTDSAFKLKQFLQSLPIPIYTVWSVVALEGTRLHDRLLMENRIEDRQIMNTPWDSNIIPKHMSISEFATATKGIITSLYSEHRFEERLIKASEILKPNSRFIDIKNKELASKTIVAILREIRSTNRELYDCVIKLIMDKGNIAPYLLSIMMLYMQIQYLIENDGKLKEKNEIHD